MSSTIPPTPSSGTYFEKEEGINTQENVKIPTTSTTTPTTTTPTPSSSTYTETNAEGKFQSSFALFGVDKYYDEKKLAKALRVLGVPFTKIKKVVPNDFGIISFENQEERIKWMHFINDNKRIDGKLLKAVERKFKEKRALPNATSSRGEKRIRVETPDLQNINDTIAPLYKKSYAEQINKKQEDFKKILKNAGKRISQESKYNIPLWVKSLKGRLCCDVENIHSLDTPFINHYRNKASFSIGYDYNGQPCIGFNEGRIEHGVTTLADPTDAIILPSIMIKIRNSVQSLVIKSGLPPWNKMERKGFWRNLTVKAFTSGEIMILFQVNPFQVAASKNTTTLKENEQTEQNEETEESEKNEENEVSDEGEKSEKNQKNQKSQPKIDENKFLDEPDMTHVKELILKHFEEESKKEDGFKVNSIGWQVYTGVSDSIPSDIPYQLLWGKSQVTENLLGMKFKISPNAFFQTNTRATELLYKVVRDYTLKQIIPPKPNTPAEASGSSSSSGSQAQIDHSVFTFGTDFELPSLIFDVCCGTGTIGQYLAKEIEIIQLQRREKVDVRVIGLELSNDAVKDALQNARENGLTNYTCIQGKAEHTFRRLLYGVRSEDRVVAIVDPPRSGLHTDVIKAIRECGPISRVVYVSCNPQSLLKDLAHFARSPSNSMIGAPFRPLKAVCVDMFPHTENVESVVLLQREKDVAVTEQHKK